MAKLFSRKSKSIPSPITFCLVVEGVKTEYNYFRDAKADFDKLQRYYQTRATNAGYMRIPSCSLLVKCAGGRSFVNVVSTAIRQTGLGHRKVWCVVDADFYVRLQGKDKADADAKYNEAVAKGVDIIFSRPCFEVWFRHHFNRQTSAWINGDTSKQRICRLWPDYMNKPQRHWELLLPQIEVALANAQAVRQHFNIPPSLVENCDASTDVDWLIRELFFDDEIYDQ